VARFTLKICVLLLVCGLLMSAGCGYKDDLYLPETDKADAVKKQKTAVPPQPLND